MDVNQAVAASASPKQFLSNVLLLVAKLKSFGPGLLKALSTVLDLERRVAPFISTLVPALAPYLKELETAVALVIQHGPELGDDLDKIGELIQNLTGLDVSGLTPVSP